MRMVDLIIKKREKQELTDEEIHFWIDGYVAKRIPDYQTSAMCMAIVFNGMSKREVVTLTDAMEHSGDVLDLSNIKGIKVDKHSTGGVGDKTTLVLGPMVAACGVPVVKISGRGLGHTGGTLDKLESIPGVTTQLSETRLIDQINRINIAIAGQTKELVHADKLMYALRDVTGTVESIPLIAASVMSKKLAVGSDGILLEVTVGNGAFMKNIDQARQLANLMVDIGNSLNRNTIALLSNMDEPLGLAVGNILEVKETVNSLKGNGPEDLMELCYKAGALMLIQANVTDDEAEARKMLEEAITSGKAFEKFLELVEEQGGDTSYLLDLNKFEISKNIIEIKSEVEGYVKHINALNIGLSSMKLGGGRETIEDKIDMTAGMILNKKVGDYIKKGELLVTVHTNKDKDVYEPILKEIVSSFEIVNEFVPKENVIKEVIKR